MDPNRGGVTRRGVLAGTLALPAVRAAAEGGWPRERVTIVTSLPAGSSVDVVTRVLADWLSARWGQPVVVDNRGGANGVTACELVARARPDGLTLLATSAMTHAANPALYERLPYDPVRDFAAIGRYGDASPFVLMANRGLGAATLAALTARLRGEPGRYNFGFGSIPARVAAELYRMEAGVDLVHVGYRGNQQAFPDLLEGRLALMCVDVVGAKPLVDAGSVAALAQSTTARHPALPGVPTAVEAGLPGFTFATWSGLYAPSGTPARIVADLGDELQGAQDAPAVRDRLAALGWRRGARDSPAEFQAYTVAEMARWGGIIRRAGIGLE